LLTIALAGHTYCFEIKIRKLQDEVDSLKTAPTPTPAEDISCVPGTSFQESFKLPGDKQVVFPTK